MRLTLKPTAQAAPPTDEQQLREAIKVVEQEESKPAPAKKQKRASKSPLSDGEQALRKANRLLNTPELLAALKRDLPEVHKLAAVFGKWVWIEFPMKPHESVMRGIKLLGFNWSSKRNAWYHPCGTFSGPSKTDPRFKYQATSAVEYETEPQPIYIDMPELSARVGRLVAA